MGVAGELYRQTEKRGRTAMWNRLRIIADEDVETSVALLVIEALNLRYLEWKDNPKREGDLERLFMVAVKTLVEERPKDRRGDMILHILRIADEGLPEAQSVVEGWHDQVEALPEWAITADHKTREDVFELAHECQPSEELRPLWERLRRRARELGEP
jgi:hypothetical protein